jgi:hypothetical protein
VISPGLLQGFTLEDFLHKVDLKFGEVDEQQLNVGWFMAEWKLLQVGEGDGFHHRDGLTCEYEFVVAIPEE